MSTTLNFISDSRGYNTYAPSFAKDNFSVTLPAASAVSFTVPSNVQKWVLVFSSSSGVNYWVARNTTAAVPAGATFASTLSCLNPSARFVEAGDVISVISTEGGGLGVSLYAIP